MFDDYAATSQDQRCWQKRLSLLSNGKERYELKTPYRDGTTHVIFEPMDCAPGKAALILQVKVLSWKVKLAPLSNESCAAAGNFRGEA